MLLVLIAGDGGFDLLVAHEVTASRVALRGCRHCNCASIHTHKGGPQFVDLEVNASSEVEALIDELSPVLQ